MALNTAEASAQNKKPHLPEHDAVSGDSSGAQKRR